MSRNLKKLGIVFATFLLILGTLPFVGLSQVKAADEQGADKITIGTIKNAAGIPAGMADNSSAFKKNNIDVEVKVYNSNTELNQAIKDGTVNVAASNLVSYASLVKSNPTWKVAGTLPGYHALVANKKYKSFKSLKGKTIAIDKNDASKQYLKKILKKHKVKYSSVKVKQIDADSDRVNSLKSGEVDAAVLEDPAISDAKGNGAKILNRQKISGDNGNVLIINNDFAKKNRSSTQILTSVMDDQIKQINRINDYGMASAPLRNFGISNKGAKIITKINVKFKKIHKVKKSDFKKAFKYAKSQKLYKGKINYKKNTLKVKNIK
ncbi:ABC transporter substrate-binding protein [Companilactobacillus halodurans]|uniref:Transporter substrate-binding domain-containing protein n=1 Tax=Companilactobacillus halodurans TaxID=2584183 RepID=A0A5P1A028_9LACO|nr:ABC transporter substrate-binding protein [Companilactobacillus halodurans]MQS76929.1 transporter substrate-binding domain-containing protein [Companilactobacillus halodurans]MQS98567.1 transporter substrate-binding domain-containing protein [Companilactobacillus halodurans]